MDDKIKSLLSLCSKAGALCAGEETVEKALRGETAKLVIISEDASENTKKKFVNKSFFYKVPAYIYGSREEISAAIGKCNRVTLAIMDKNFSLAIEKQIKDSPGGQESV